MQAEHFYGTYARFETKSKKDAGTLLGADNLVGDTYKIVFEIEDGTHRAWIKNRFDHMIGFLNPSESYQLSVLQAKGWTLRALLSFVAFTDAPEPGHYWGEVGILCFDPQYTSEFDTFTQGLSIRLMEGTRPELAFSDQAVLKIIESSGSWQPNKTVPLPEKTAGTAIVKSRRKISEKLIEEGRKGNKGCLVANWIFLLLLVTFVVYAIHSCTAG